jgi:hypothetical protein
MSEIETGHKWWIRYVIVPLCVAVVGVILIALNHSANSVYKVPPQTTSREEEQTETLPATVPNVEITALDELYIVDEHEKALVKDARVRKGSVFTVKWDGRDVSSGQLHLLILGANGNTVMDRKVGQMGLQKVSSDYRIAFKLVEDYNGKQRLIKELPVQIF